MKTILIFLLTASLAFGQSNTVNGKGGGITDPAAFRGALDVPSNAEVEALVPEVDAPSVAAVLPTAITSAGPAEVRAAAGVKPPTLRGLDGIPHPNYIAHRGASAQFPGSSQASFDSAVAFGVPILEPDLHLLADGSLAIMHDANEVLLDGASTTDAALYALTGAQWKSRVTYNPLGYATWTESPVFGHAGTIFPGLLFEDLLKLYGNQQILMPEFKTAGCAPPTLALLVSYGIEKNMMLIQGGTGRYTELQTVAAAGWPTMMHGITSGFSGYMAEGITWTAFGWSETANIMAAKLAGMRVACSTANLHFEADTALAAGADLIYTDEPLYVPQRTKHRLVHSPYFLGKTYHGHRINNKNRLAVSNGEITFTTASPESGAEVLLGWAGPAQTPFNWTFDFTVTFSSVANASRYVSLWISKSDRRYDLLTAGDLFGFDILVRADGRLQIYEYNGVAAIVGSEASGTALGMGATGSFRVTVTEAAITLENMGSGLSTTYATTLVHKKYLSLRCAGNNSTVGGMVMKDFSRSY